jgi:hypothetical protein
VGGALLHTRTGTAILYVGIVVLLNVNFSHSPDLDWLWSLLVGSVLVMRDYTQRVWGNWCLALMAVAAILSYAFGSHEVALASAAAFAISETADWATYTIIRRPFADRVLLSTAVSAPVDSTAFLLLAGIFTWPLLIVGVTSKCSAGVIVWLMLRWRGRGAPATAAPAEQPVRPAARRAGAG